MKSLFFAFLLIALVVPLRADDWLTNGDFTNGNDHWYGQAKWPSDFAAADPFTPADPLTAKGMIIPLQSSAWVGAFQDFKGKTATAILKITYVVAPNTAFSTQTTDYQNMPDKIGWDSWKPFNTPAGAFVVFISELQQNRGRYFLVQPNTSKTGEQTFQGPVSGMTPWSPKTIALAFPPGQGTLVVHKVELVDPNGQ
jgi:hypothetical protein